MRLVGVAFTRFHWTLCKFFFLLLLLLHGVSGFWVLGSGWLRWEACCRVRVVNGLWYWQYGTAVTEIICTYMPIRILYLGREHAALRRVRFSVAPFSPNGFRNRRPPTCECHDQTIRSIQSRSPAVHCSQSRSTRQQHDPESQKRISEQNPKNNPKLYFGPSRQALPAGSCKLIGQEEGGH